MSQRFVGGKASTDLYKLLQIEQGCTLKEIKAAYKKQALLFHPDRTNGDPHKTQRFKDITEAYSVLSNDASRRQYDLQHGFRYNQNRRTAPPKNYRKVYAPVPPPNVKRAFDHTRHYEMHYGRGMMDEAVKQATREAQQRGEPTGYQSPLGKGFSFSGGINNTTNPYAKGTRSRQQESVWEYEEGTMFDQDNGKGTIHRREEIVQDMNGKRRIRKMNAANAARREQERANSAFQVDDSCVIQ
jgi:DnaJ-class molecular chaperone